MTRVKHDQLLLGPCLARFEAWFAREAGPSERISCMVHVMEHAALLAVREAYFEEAVISVLDPDLWGKRI